VTSNGGLVDHGRLGSLEGRQHRRLLTVYAVQDVWAQDQESAGLTE